MCTLDEAKLRFSLRKEGKFLPKTVIEIEGFWDDLSRHSEKFKIFPQNRYILVVFSYI